MNQPLDRSIGMAIKAQLDPHYAHSHAIKAGVMMAPDEANGFSGGYSFYIVGRYWVGKVNVMRRSADGLHTMIFGRFPKTAAGTNEWKVDHVKDNVPLDKILDTLKFISTPEAQVEGGTTAAMLKKRGKRPTF